MPWGRVPPRHARYYRGHNGTELRTLTKAFGIRFDVLVYGNVCMGCSAPRTYRGCRADPARSPPCLPSGWEIRHRPHAHQHRGCLHLHRRGESAQGGGQTDAL